MPAAMKIMWEPDSAARISSAASSAAASPISGSEPAPSPSVRLTPSWMRSARPWRTASACMSVLATTNLTLPSPAAIMLLTTLPPAPPTPMTVICGFFILPCCSAMGVCSMGIRSRRLSG